MHRVYVMAISLITGIAAGAMAPVARADDSVMYEVASSDVTAADVEYSDISGRKVLPNVALPWRVNATVVNPHSSNATLHADWQPAVGRYKWVSVRIWTRGSLLCEVTNDVGKADCYGSGRSYGPVPPIQWCPPPLESCDIGYRH